jgi:hypothetical protein
VLQALQDSVNAGPVGRICNTRSISQSSEVSQAPLEAAHSSCWLSRAGAECSKLLALDENSLLTCSFEAAGSLPVHNMQPTCVNCPLSKCLADTLQVSNMYWRCTILYVLYHLAREAQKDGMRLGLTALCCSPPSNHCCLASLCKAWMRSLSRCRGSLSRAKLWLAQNRLTEV